jgi:hypothetical protein
MTTTEDKPRPVKSESKLFNAWFEFLRTDEASGQMVVHCRNCGAVTEHDVHGFNGFSDVLLLHIIAHNSGMNRH